MGVSENWVEKPLAINGHFRNLNWRYLPYIRPIYYVRGYPPKIWPYMVLTYLHFRILEISHWWQCSWQNWWTNGLRGYPRCLKGNFGIQILVTAMAIPPQFAVQVSMGKSTITTVTINGRFSIAIFDDRWLPEGENPWNEQRVLFRIAGKHGDGMAKWARSDHRNHDTLR